MSDKSEMTLETENVDPSLVDPSLVENPENTAEIPEEKVDTEVEKLTEASKNIVITPEVAAKLDELHKKMAAETTARGKKKVWTDFFKENKEAVDLLLQGRSSQPEAGQAEPGVAEKLRDHLAKVQESVVRNLQEEVALILQSGDEQEKGEKLRAQLGKVGFSSEKVEEIVSKLLSTEEPITDIESFLRAQIEENFEVVVDALVEEEILRKSQTNGGGRSAEGDEVGPREVYGVFQGTANEFGQVFEDMDVPGAIDFFFAVDHGYHSSMNRHVEKWKEPSDLDKERESLDVIKKVTSSEIGAKAFFVDLSGAEDDKVLEDNNLLQRLTAMFYALEDTTNQEAVRNHIKERISKAVEKAAKTDPTLVLLGLESSRVNLSDKVLDLIISSAEEFVNKKPEKTP